MADKNIEKVEKQAKASAISYARAWGGESESLLHIVTAY